MINQDDLFNSLKNMIEWTKNIQSQIIICRKASTAKYWAEECCTIKFCLPRQSGHTTFAKKLFESYFKRAIYLASNYNVLYDVKNNWKEINGIDLCRLGTIHDVKRGKFLGITPDAVIIDCASLLSAEDIKEIYKAFSPIAINQPAFIFLFLE